MNTVKKHRQRTIDRIHLLVRMELANPLMNSTDIAKLVGLNIYRFSQLKRTNAYQQIHNTYHSAILTNLDHKVENVIGLTQETLKLAVTVAMQALLK
jgi:hypothetical protein